MFIMLGNQKTSVFKFSDTRVEDYFFEKLDKKREHPSNLDLLGQDMIDAGADIGSQTPYGNILHRIFFIISYFLLCY